MKSVKYCIQRLVTVITALLTVSAFGIKDDAYAAPLHRITLSPRQSNVSAGIDSDPGTMFWGALLKNANSGQCLAIGGADQTWGAPAIQWDCLQPRESEQMWDDVTDPYWFPWVGLKVFHSGLCLGVAAASTAPGARAVQWECTFHSEQLWRLDEGAPGVYSIVNLNSKQCLAVGGASQQQGAPVIQWTCTGGSEQQWRLILPS
jgi:hypothetical protein